MLVACSVLALARPAAAASPGSTITLTSQTSWVDNSSGITLGLAVSSFIPASNLEVEVSLYTQITSRTVFSQTLTGGLDSLAVLSTVKVPLPSVLAKGQSSGQISLQLPLVAPGVPNPKGAIPRAIPTSRYLQMSCTAGYCDGVYPLRVSLVNVTSSEALSTFTTHLIFVPQSPVALPLRFTFVVPLGTAPALSPSGKADPTPASTAGITSVTTALTATPGAPLTLAVYPQILQALAARGDKQVIGKLKSAIAADSSELITTPYTSVNPAAFATAGIGGDLALQLHRGSQALQSELGTTGDGGMFVDPQWAGARSLALLGTNGLTKVVLPSANVGLPTAWAYPVTARFTTPGSRVEIANADSGLAAHLTGPGDAVLRAHQLLADLAEIYFAAPGADNPVRGVVLSAPTSWQPDTSFLEVALRGLASSPIVSTVSLARYFQVVPAGTCAPPGAPSCSPSSLPLSYPVFRTTDVISTPELSAARLQLSELGSVVPTATTLLSQMNDSLLLGETAGLGPVERQAYFQEPGKALRSMAQQLSVSTGRTITVTSHSARIPISVNSTSVLPMHVLLNLSSSSLTLPVAIRSQPMVLNRGGNFSVIHVNVPGSGDSTLNVRLLTPSGLTLLASGQVTVRPTVFSGVAIGLTVGAAAFLVIWWARSVLRRGRKRAGRHTRRRRRARANGGTPPEPSA